ncbi:hypothetical protein [Rhodoferax sp.]|uniref:hypothetical protein n=1 Tax=Rhodoferax sp. TaxID=50421 RepID=UPI002730CD79|nr:hypothetical protein [Rhodoferax sp.]MDP1529205.1 hypothetical protein [Rhodoferax sp.]MDP1943968.1 hypothetical protein [Rhodoferax sp.]MDP2441673.1 hypothetical protein [Rhodoferax sp.]MDP3190581.1 hypothetical protein [Rhodoferax sp.]MDP3337049.1 hypothetical protein [Rhodoferax sp.]
MTDNNVHLNAAAEDYFGTLEGMKYPQALAQQYPRIAQTIFNLKDDETQLRACFASLIEDARGDRHGFPFDVLMDIQALREIMLGDVNQFVADDTTKWVS